MRKGRDRDRDAHFQCVHYKPSAFRIVHISWFLFLNCIQQKTKRKVYSRSGYLQFHLT